MSISLQPGALESVLAAAALWALGVSQGGPAWKKVLNRLGLSKSQERPDPHTPAPGSDPALRNEDWQRAVKIFEAEGRFREAARILQENGQNYEAGRLLVQAGGLTEAAFLFEQAGHYSKAAEVYEQAGDNRRAGENYRRHLEDRFGSLAGTGAPTDRAEFRHYCRLAGQAFERAGLLEQSAEALERGEHWEQAASLHLKLARYAKAADLYQRAGAVDRAADVYARAGDRSRAAQMRGESLYKNERKNEAAVQFLLGGDPLRAAEVYEEAGNYLDAGRCYEHCGALRQAAEAYRRAGLLSRAAEMFGRSQDYEQSGELYEEAGELARAGEMYAEAGQYYRAARIEKEAGLVELAISHLQKVKPEHPDYQAASLELAQHFMHQGLAGVAVEKLRRVIGGRPLSAENLDIYYALVEACEQMGDYQAAADILKKVVAEDYGYRDAVGRLEKVAKLAEAARKRQAEAARAEKGESGDRYEFQERLGAGGMGVVYKAYDRRLKRVVAYKMLMEQFMELEEVRKGFLSEARSAAILSHPNIVTIYDVGFERGRLFISMEFVDGVTYFDLLQRDGRLSIPASFHFMTGVLRALAHAHARGVIHRDIKPTNVMLSRDGVVKIADFGLAKVLKQGKDEETKRVSGTPLYMSPEQILGKTVDFRADIYAFGSTVFHLLAGEPPFAEGEVLYHHVHSEPRRLVELRPELPPGLDSIVMRCLSKDPEARFQRADDILSALSALRSGPS